MENTIDHTALEIEEASPRHDSGQLTELASGGGSFDVHAASYKSIRNTE